VWRYDNATVPEIVSRDHAVLISLQHEVRYLKDQKQLLLERKSETASPDILWQPINPKSDHQSMRFGAARDFGIDWSA